MESTPQPRVYWARKAVKFLGILALGVVVFFLALAAWILWPDSAPPDDLAMHPKWDATLAGNPLGEFQSWLATDPSLPDIQALRKIEEAEAWNSPEALALIESSQAAEAKFRELMATADQPWQWQEGSGIADYSADTSYLFDLINLAKLEQLQTRRLASQGKLAESLQIAEGLLVTGKGLTQAKGPVIHYLVGITHLGIGAKTIEAVLDGYRDSLQPADLESLAKVLETTAPEGKDLAFALKCEYAAFKKEALGRGSSTGTGASARWGFLQDPYYRPHETLRLYLEPLIPVVKGLEHDFPQALQAAKTAEAGIQLKLSKPSQALFHRNAAGKVLLSVSVPSISSFVEKHGKALLQHRELQLRVAALRYELDHKSAPQSMDDLIPQYLAKPLLDPFTGMPLSLSAK